VVNGAVNGVEIGVVIGGGSWPSRMAMCPVMPWARQAARPQRGGCINGR
jgi:hypothetical protein